MNNLFRNVSVSALFSGFILFSSFSQVFAEDIEIYNRTQTVPNVLFVIDASGSMNDYISGSSGPTRLDVVQSAFSTLLSQQYSLLNVGFMDFRSWTGSGVDMPVVDVNQLASNVEPGVTSTTETYAELLTRSVNAISASSGTPTVEALYEAALYFRGEEPFEGDRYKPHTSWNDSTSKYQGGHWTSAGLRTYTGGTITQVGAGTCGQAPHPSGTPYSECNNPFPGSCVLVPAASGTYQQCTGGFTCTGGYGSDGSCLAWTCNGYTTQTWSDPEYTRCQETEDRLVGSNYVSPIQSACTANYIVLLSDGIPSEDDYWTDQGIKGLTGKTTCDDLGALGITDTTIIDKGACGVDLAEYLNTVDQSSSTAGTNQPGDQFITTHTIGFQLGATSEGKKYLDEIALAGGGTFYNASDPTSLATALQNIVGSITEKPRVISRIATSLDLSNLGSTRPEVYVPLFANSPNEPRWPGNLKGFNVNLLGDLEGIGSPPNPAFLEIDLDSDGVPDDKIFNPAVRSFWSSSADGADIQSGGVASLISPIGRSIKTENGTGGLMELDTGVTALNGNPGLFGLPGTTTATEIDRLIGWANGFDSFDEDGDTNLTEARNYVGDALHSDPVVASYDTDNDGNLEIVTYFMTNEGMLHAIDATSNTSASEIFAFMPRDLLDNLDPLQKNVGGMGKIYGLDGPLVLFQEGGPTNVTGNKYLFFGMRRGGMNYYALNVTDPSNPSLIWTINGGTGDFTEMGQSWSAPIVTNVDVGGTSTLAVVIGGGYDTDQDTTNVYTTDDQGRAVYIVDAVNDANNDGQADLLWSAGPSSTPAHDLTLTMNNAVAGDVSVIDLDNDTIADRLYFGDVGGQLWRIDLQGDITNSSNYSGYLLADLSGTTTADNRRFFSRPVAAMTASGKLAVTIGSGNRAHPLEAGVTNRFYTIFDPNPTTVPSTAPSAIDDSDLQDLTGFSAGFDYSSSTASGWRIDLSTDEKVFAEAAVLRGELFFSTYIPPSNVCSNIPDGANLYVLNLDGEPTRDLSSTPDGIKDAFTSVFTYGILPAMSGHYGSDGRVSGLFGPNTLELYKAGALEDKFWTNKP